MRRYVFDLREGGTLKPDPNGTEFATIDAVRDEAAKALVDLVRDNVLSNGHQATRDLPIEIRDIDDRACSLVSYFK